MKPVLLVFPKHSPFPHSRGFPLAIYSLGAYLEKHGFKVLYYDERVQPESLLESHLRQNPILVGISTMTSYQITKALGIAKKVRHFDKSIPLAWGGVHPSMLPFQTMESPFVDFVINKEGEQTLLELVQELNSEKPDYSKIKGLLWNNNGKTVFNGERNFLDFNKLPSPYDAASDALIKFYMKKETVRDAIIYQTSRGCPHRCRFCYNRYFNKQKWRSRNLELVEKELTRLRNLGVTSTFFVDDDLGPNKEHLLGIAKITKKLGISWSAPIRLQYMTKDVVKKLEEGNCKYLFFGVESGSDKMLKTVVDKGETVAEMVKGIDLIADSKIKPMYSFVLGFPDETPDHLPETFKLVDYIVKKDKSASIQLQIFNPLPGTPAYETAVEYGFKPPKKLADWSDVVSDEVRGPWIKNKALLRNLYVISVLAFRSEELLGNKLFYIPNKIAKWRWKHKFFALCIERRIYDLIKKTPFLE
ncbi:MAG: B12-binding domain-containing radical SAM protein [bacterium]|nr:B12-binding domain-containing radical SAM protein [bacterium]